MGSAADRSVEILDQVRDAVAARRALEIRGGGSKAFHGRPVDGAALETTAHRGILSYAPTELVITARAGTPLAEIEAALAEQGQMLGFEPPRVGRGGTLGGAIATGLSGPRRPYAGAARDFVLGVRVVTGKGEMLRFGGEVMKNVAGYDIARLMCGACGTLGVLLDVSLRVVPVPEVERTLAFDVDAGQAIGWMNEWAGRPLPLSGAAWRGGRLWLRLSGTRRGVEAARGLLDGAAVDEADAPWTPLRDFAHPYFEGRVGADAALWRLAVPSGTPPIDLPGEWLIDWGGGQRWLADSDATEAEVRLAASGAGGHAQRFAGGDRSGEVFHPLDAARLDVHRGLKAAFDPSGVLNPGRLFAGI